MNLQSKLFGACVSGLFMGLLTQVFPFRTTAQVMMPSEPAAQKSPQLSIEQLRQLARSVTVKVPAGKSWGSGILIEKQGQTYTVLTNHHVIKYESSYQIQTLDGQIYPADLIRTVRFDDHDLALLSFRSNQFYTVASLGDSSTLTMGDEVFAAGFPFGSEMTGSKGFVFTMGQVSLFSDKAFAGGYQIGYTNAVEKGMSGGPVLNRQGQVVGVNGIHAYPLWGNPYVFKDGSMASAAMQQQMSRYSWAIPIDTFVQLASGIYKPARLPAANRSPRLPTNNTPSVPPSSSPVPENSVAPSRVPVPLW